MLVPTRPDDEKTVMGLFSLTPEFKKVERLKEALAFYQQKGFSLFFWQQGETDSVLGLIGCEQYARDLIVVRQLILTPGSQKRANYHQMLTDLQNYYPAATLMGTLSNKALINQWRKQHVQSEPNH
ncbi:riboflavin biosynthesis protein RibT [Leuconostocaceae bacterium ESL0958]|nr:riboflavin biosynthesis protein RibT [Leuconostocaceae bacterium ESL0958]